MKQHYLKIYPKYYDAVESGRKTFELRYNDRDIKTGDELILEEYSALSGEYTGRKIRKVVTYILPIDHVINIGELRWQIFGLGELERKNKVRGRNEV